VTVGTNHGEEHPSEDVGAEPTRPPVQRVAVADRLEDIVQGITMGLDAMNLGVTMTDVEGKIIYVNPTEAKLHHRAVDELLGHDVGVLAPAGTRKPLTISELKQLKSWKRESVNVRKDGTHFPVLLRSDVVINTSGEPLGIVTTCADIGELRAAQDALSRSETEHYALVENASYGICRSSVDGRFLTVNRALVEMLGFESKAELLDMSLAKNIYVDPDDFATLVDRCIDPSIAADMEVEWNSKYGERLTVRISGRASRGELGEIDSYEFIVEDVTSRRQLEAQLRQAQKLEALGQLTGGIAHDFNNILTVIQANVGLVAADLPPEAEQLHSDLRETQKATRRAADLVKKLLAFSRREELSRQLLDLTELVGGVTTTLRRLLPEHIEVKVVAEEHVGKVFADPNAVEQIILNLATNARDAMPDGGLLYVETRRAWLAEQQRGIFGARRAGEYACIVVSDSGEGMDERTQQKLFEPFFTTKPAGQGTGLGMAMVHGLVKQHHGFVHVYSEVGQGTTLKVYFPTARAESVDAASSGYEGEDESAWEGTETILVVEDEAQIRNVAKRVLERRGYRVLVADDGEEGLRMYRDHQSEIALVLSDVIMPKLGGPGLYEAIKAEAGTTRFVFMSGHSAHVLRMSGHIEPSVPFVYKPWTDAELLRRVRETLDSAPVTFG
jgi:two-component system cell cycle sensor histidine kinase/response regulator CckA